MFDWPKHKNIQKFVSCEKPFMLSNSSPSQASHPDFIFMIMEASRVPALARVLRLASGDPNHGVKGGLGLVVAVEAAAGGLVSAKRRRRSHPRR